MRKNESEAVPTEVKDALNANSDLKQALQQSQMPVRFQAMVLGLTTLRQMNSEYRTDPR